MRCNSQFDEATALEILINLFLSKKHYANGSYTYTPLTQHISILFLLIKLESSGIGRELSEISWKNLTYLHKSNSDKFRWNAPTDLFSDNISHFPPQISLTEKDYFHHKLGYLGPDNYSTNSRFGSYTSIFPNTNISSSLKLGDYKFPEKSSDWFDNTGGELMGAFLHVQVQDKSNPFGICLKVPPLNSVENKNEFPFPCINQGTGVLKVKNKKEGKVDWEKIVENAVENKNLPEFDEGDQKRLALWEKREKTIKMQGILHVKDKKYEEFLVSYLDKSYRPSEKPIELKVFIRNLKNLILNIPNALYDLDEYKPKSRFRLESHSHDMLVNFLREIMEMAKGYRFLVGLAVEMERKNELIGPAFAKGIKEILAFYENFIIEVPESLTLIEFCVMTKNLREQIESLRIVCSNIPNGLRLIDYLYIILTKNEGDFENYHLLQKLFKNIIQPILNTLTDFTYTGEINDIYNEFYIQYNNPSQNLNDFSLEKYSQSFTSLESTFFDPIREDLLKIGRNLQLLKFLNEDLSSYYQLLSSASLSSLKSSNITLPHFKISYKTAKLHSKSDDFLAFNAEQTRCLLALEKKIIEGEEENYQILQSKKAKQILTTKLLSQAKMKMDAERYEEKRRKQWSFYQVLEGQLKENHELKRIEEEKKRREEKKLEEKIEQEQVNLVEMGKKYLIEKHEEMLGELYRKRALEMWKANRKELNEKRAEAFRRYEEELAKELMKLENPDMALDESPELKDTEMKDSDNLPFLSQKVPPFHSRLTQSQQIVNQSIDLSQDPNTQSFQNTSFSIFKSQKSLNLDPIPTLHLSNKPSETLSISSEKITEDPAPNPFPARIRQPPGGISTMSEHFTYTFTVPEQAPIVDLPRIGYREDLEKLEICSSLLWEEVLRRVFRKITPKKNWEIMNKDLTGHVFDDLFENFDEKRNLNKNLQIPFNKVVETLVLEPVRMQAKMIDKACVHLFVRKLKIMEHLKALKRYALLEAGDTIDLFLNTIFSMNFSGNMTAAWEGCLKMSSSRDDEYGENFRILVKANNLYRMQFHTVENIDLLSISYNAKGPLSLILSTEVQAQYSKAFCSLLRVKHVTSVLSNIKTFRVPTNHIFYRKIHLLRQKMQHFLDIYQGYIASEVHGTSWKYLTKGLAKAESIEEILKVHKEYLDLIMVRCFLEGKGLIVNEQLNMIFQLVMRFRNIVMEFDEFSLSRVEDVEDDFNSIHRFLFKMTQTMASKGNYPELFLRLDFNGFMTKKIEKERMSS